MNEPIKFLIFGMGALGSVFGAFLQQSGKLVHYYGKGLHYATVQQKGLNITGIWGEFHIQPLKTFYKLEDIQEKYDIILLCVKSNDTEKAVMSMTYFLKPNGLVVSIQNGLNNIETIAKYVGSHRTVGARVIFGVEIPHPGTAKVTVYADKVLLGTPFESVNNILLKYLEESLNNAKIPTEIVPDIMVYIWGKVLYNSILNPLGAILDVEYGMLGEFPETEDIMCEILKEIFYVLSFKGIKVPYTDYQHYYQFFKEKQLPPTYNHHSSMLQDLKNGRLTEIDALNGAICEYAKELGISVPYNTLLTKLIKFKQLYNRKIKEKKNII